MEQPQAWPPFSKSPRRISLMAQGDQKRIGRRILVKVVQLSQWIKMSWYIIKLERNTIMNITERLIINWHCLEKSFVFSLSLMNKSFFFSLATYLQT